MKKFTKIVIITSAVCMVAGTVIMSASLAIDGELHRQVTRTKKEVMTDVLGERVVDIEDNIIHSAQVYSEPMKSDSVSGNEEMSFRGVNKLEVSVLGGSVQVMEGGSGDEITVKISDQPDQYYCYMEDENELVLEMRPSGNGGLSEAERKIQVLIPAGYVLHEAEFYAEEGSIDISSLTADQAEIEVGTGVAELTDSEVRSKLEAKCGSGAIFINLRQKEDEFAYEVETNEGSVSIGGHHYEGEGHKEQEWKMGHGRGKKMELECGTGMIAVEFSGTEK